MYFLLFSNRKSNSRHFSVDRGVTVGAFPQFDAVVVPRHASSPALALSAVRAAHPIR